MNQEKTPKQRLLDVLQNLQEQRVQLFQLYLEAKVEANKRDVLDTQLQIMIALSKIKQLLGIKDEGGET